MYAHTFAVALQRAYALPLRALRHCQPHPLPSSRPLRLRARHGTHFLRTRWFPVGTHLTVGYLCYLRFAHCLRLRFAYRAPWTCQLPCPLPVPQLQLDYIPDVPSSTFCSSSYSSSTGLAVYYITHFGWLPAFALVVAPFVCGYCLVGCCRTGVHTFTVTTVTPHGYWYTPGLRCGYADVGWLIPTGCYALRAVHVYGLRDSTFRFGHITYARTTLPVAGSPFLHTVLTLILPLDYLTVVYAAYLAFCVALVLPHRTRTVRFLITPVYGSLTAAVTLGVRPCARYRMHGGLFTLPVLPVAGLQFQLPAWFAIPADSYGFLRLPTHYPQLRLHHTTFTLYPDWLPCHGYRFTFCVDYAVAVAFYVCGLHHVAPQFTTGVTVYGCTFTAGTVLATHAVAHYFNAGLRLRTQFTYGYARFCTFPRFLPVRCTARWFTTLPAHCPRRSGSAVTRVAYGYLYRYGYTVAFGLRLITHTVAHLVPIVLPSCTLVGHRVLHVTLPHTHGLPVGFTLATRSRLLRCLPTSAGWLPFAVRYYPRLQLRCLWTFTRTTVTVPDSRDVLDALLLPARYLVALRTLHRCYPHPTDYAFTG